MLVGRAVSLRLDPADDRHNFTWARPRTVSKFCFRLTAIKRDRVTGSWVVPPVLVTTARDVLRDASMGSARAEETATPAENAATSGDGVKMLLVSVESAGSDWRGKAIRGRRRCQDESRSPKNALRMATLLHETRENTGMRS